MYIQYSCCAHLRPNFYANLILSYYKFSARILLQDLIKQTRHLELCKKTKIRCLQSVTPFTIVTIIHVCTVEYFSVVQYCGPNM
jgi:hypothetical protein